MAKVATSPPPFSPVPTPPPDNVEKPQKRRLADIRSAAIESVTQDLQDEMYDSTKGDSSPTSDDGSHTFYDAEHAAEDVERAAEETDSLYPNGER
jgi:hypothetical protein